MLPEHLSSIPVLAAFAVLNLEFSWYKTKCNVSLNHLSYCPFSSNNFFYLTASESSLVSSNLFLLWYYLARFDQFPVSLKYWTVTIKSRQLFIRCFTLFIINALFFISWHSIKLHISRIPKLFTDIRHQNK